MNLDVSKHQRWLENYAAGTAVPEYTANAEFVQGKFNGGLGLVSGATPTGDAILSIHSDETLPDFTGNNLTIAMWVNFMTSTVYQTETCGVLWNNFKCAVKNNKIVWGDDAGTDVLEHSLGSFAANTWVHIACQRDTSGGRSIFVDGVEVETGTGLPPPTHDGVFSLLMSLEDFILDDVRVYNTLVGAVYLMTTKYLQFSYATPRN